MPSRKPFVGGNWKSFSVAPKVTALINALAATEFPSSVDVLVAPPSLYIPAATSALSPSIIVSSQNVSATGEGAFTGEISATGLASFGVKWTLIGHSERRSLYGETDAAVTAKVTAALVAGVSVVACVGESLSEREAGATVSVVTTQLAAVAAGVAAAVAAGAPLGWEAVVVAYEPVWAIGTGKVASPQQAQDVHAAIRQWLAANTTAVVAETTRIIYGGSVKPSNAAELGSQTDIDGFLVGGASLVAGDFKAIVVAAGSAKGDAKL